MGRMLDTYIDSNCEADGTHSSARLYAGWMLIFVIFIQFGILSTITWKVLRLDPSLSTAPAILTLYVSVLKMFLMWSILFDVATALSLYGINVWKYVAAMRTGSVVGDDTPDAPPPVVTQEPAPGAPTAEAEPGADRT